MAGDKSIRDENAFMASCQRSPNDVVEDVNVLHGPSLRATAASVVPHIDAFTLRVLDDVVRNDVILEDWRRLHGVHGSGNGVIKSVFDVVVEYIDVLGRTTCLYLHTIKYAVTDDPDVFRWLI